MSGRLTITSIAPLSGDPPRVRIKSGREVIAVVAMETIERLGLTIGDPLTDELMQTLDTAARELTAKRDALRLLSFRARSTAELAVRLRRKGYDREVADRVCGRLRDAGLVDDEAYAAETVGSILSRKPAGERFLEAKLRARGLTDDVARRAIAEHLADRDLLDDAIALAKSRIKRLRHLDDQTQRRRLYGVLARRGFEVQVCRTAVDIAMTEAP